MVTLSGSHSSPSINYYTADAISVDLATAGFAPGTTWSFTITPTLSSCAVDVDWHVYLQRPLPSTESCFAWAQVGHGGTSPTPMSYGPASVGSGVEWTGTAGATGCLDFTRVVFYLRPFMYPGSCSIDWNWSITYTPAAPSVTLCAYGTEIKAPLQTTLLVSTGLLATLSLATLNPFALAALLGVAGTAVSLVELCGQPKPTDLVIAEGDWYVPSHIGVGTLAQEKLLANFKNVLWDTYCQCTPAPSGSPPPNSPPVTIISTPTYLSYVDTVNIDNTEISTTINQLWNYVLNVNAGIQVTNNTTQQISSCTCTDYKLGTAHEGLTGDGSIAVSGIHGFSVIYTTLPARIGVAEGDPDTIYEAGWVNVGNDWGWQARLWPNTTRWLAFPPDMHQMSDIGYSFPADVVATIVELVQA